jgi:uncharacterized protein with von Willebrand factor type A (vWA) domain
MTEARTADGVELPLEGLYLHLVRSGFPLSTRDLTDALAALRAGYGAHRRADLHRLCETLWARTEDEVARLDRLFRQFPWPSAEQLVEATGAGATDEKSGPVASGETRSPDPPAKEAQSLAGPMIEFAAPEQSGIGLVRARVPVLPSTPYVTTPRTLVPLRSLIIALRRFRLTKRSGARVELDLRATIDEQSRQGTLVEPVLIPARRNQARLVVLVDASSSMVAWRSLNRLFGEALESSQLARAPLYFFDNVPDDDLYESDTLTRPTTLDEALARHSRCALLVVSDAGATRGNRVRERVERTRDFIARVAGAWQPIAWVNPMPPGRWRGTSAAEVAKLASVGMFGLTDDGLTRAIDWLRGKQSV